MRRLEIAPAARADIAGILDWSETRHGRAASARYERLISVCLRDLAENPDRLAVSNLTAYRPDLRGYHLRNGRRNARAGSVTVRSPRHLIVFRADPQRVHILRVLHEAMDLSSRLAETSEEDG